MSYYGAHWRIDGVTAAFIMRGDRNGRYRIVFERESAELPQIESINWAQPSVERLTEAGEFGLPEGYGFELVKITYDSAVKSYTVEVKTARPVSYTHLDVYKRQPRTMVLLGMPMSEAFMIS